MVMTVYIMYGDEVMCDDDDLRARPVMVYAYGFMCAI